MRTAVALLLAGTAAASGTWIRTPAGFVHEDCHHRVPSGTHLAHHPESGGILATHPDGAVRLLAQCPHRPALRASPPAGAEVPQRRAEALRTAESAPSAALPADYDGWLEYTAFRHNDTFDAFLGNFSVPDRPSRTPDILYLFTGLQNIDWIPKVDPMPSQPFDIIQPVLQYPGDYGDYWSVKSWYVTVDVGTVASEEAKVAGDGSVVFGNMTRTGATSWYVGSTLYPQGSTVQVTVDHPRLASQPWAYNTLECYGCDGCGTYPKQPIQFRGLALSAGGKDVEAAWEANPKPAKDRQCQEAVAIHSSASVDITFQ